MKRTIFIILAIASISILSACGGEAAPEAISVDIDMTDFAYSPADLNFSVGQEVTINLSNSGVMAHELMVGAALESHDGNPLGYGHDMFEGSQPMVMMAESDQDEHEDDADHDDGEDAEAGDHADHDGFMIVLEAGETASITFTVTESMLGEWEIGCFQGENAFHYTAGMTGKLTVTN